MLRIETSKMILSLALLLIVAMTSSPAEAFSLPHMKTTTMVHRSTTLFLARAKSKWDLLEDDDEEDQYGATFESKIPVANDMTYVERNVKRAHENFLSLRNIGGKELCNDVYAMSPAPNNEEVWYVGKVAKVSDISLEDCIARQWNLIETHATNLRPIELYPHRGNLELWSAPGDTELDVAYNRQELIMTKMEHYEVTPKQLKNNMIGFQGEVYQEGEEGFRSWRNEDGSPARPEINPGGETRPPSEAEMEQLRLEMEQQNISVEDIYKAEQAEEGKQ
mmetsp:Transcript_3653/g.8717  ORF Transcript_3653/g.8717 Transcript_3653/m.8717 type:complete len:278 (+) Transcript_3653:93-926(+)